MQSNPFSKIAIVGAGSVGATIGYACLIRGVAGKIALYDVDRPKVAAQALDLNQGLQFVPPAEVEGSDDINICVGSQVIVITAGAKQKPGQSPLDLAQQNTAICRTLIPQLLAVAPEAIMLMAMNPVDVMTHAALKISGLPPARVLGTGTTLDSSLFRFLIARRIRVVVENVHAYIVGEHGDHEIPLWSSASVANLPLHDWAVMGHGKLTVRDRTEIFQSIKDSAQQIIACKGAANHAIGLAVSNILTALLKNENRILPVSSLLENYRGITGVCMSVPTIVNKTGIDKHLDVPMNDNEIAGLRNCADVIASILPMVGF
jgi:L-lactate dehydrogenase